MKAQSPSARLTYLDVQQLRAVELSGQGAAASPPSRCSGLDILAVPVWCGFTSRGKERSPICSQSWLAMAREFPRGLAGPQEMAGLVLTR